MKRFLYDALLIVLLLLIAMSLDTSTTYKNKQEDLNQFNDKIVEKQKIEKKEGISVINQIDENKASNFAKSASGMVRDLIHGSVEFIQGIFDSITQV